jgi:hypothetical protein
VIKKEQSKLNLQWVFGPRTKVERTIEKIIEELCGNDEFENEILKFDCSALNKNCENL